MSSTTLERSQSCASSTSLSMSSPRPSIQRETTPSSSELSIIHLRDRINQLESQVFVLRSKVFTEDEYVDRRNREDQYIFREFENLRATSRRIDLNVEALRSDVERLQKSLDTRMDALNTRMDAMNKRMDSYDSDLEQARRVRFNSIAHTAHAEIQTVPVITDDGTLEWPQYFPRTVWRFWCLKKRSRLHRLIELAEFYQLGGYRAWSRMHSANFFANDSDSSESDDDSMNITRAEAVRRFPEAAHQALAATLGLVYYKIRRQVEEGPHAIQPRAPKRQAEYAASANSNAKSKPVKIARRPSVTDSWVQRLVYGPAVSESKSSTSEESAQLGWNPFPDVSEDAMNKLQSMDPQDINAILRGIEQGRLKLKPSASEKARMSPTGSKASYALGRAGAAEQEHAQVPTIPNTIIPTEPFSPVACRSRPATVSDVPETASNPDSAAS